MRRPERVPGPLQKNSVFLSSAAEQVQVSKSLNMSSLFLNSELNLHDGLSINSCSGSLGHLNVGSDTGIASTDPIS